MLCLPAAVLALCVSRALGTTIIARQESTTVAAPISITPDEGWEGIDGQWSTFTVRIGTPEQAVRTLLSWASYQTLAILPQGCMAAADEQECEDSRGGLFDYTESSTWDPVGTYALGIEQNLGLTSNAIYGYDTVALGETGEGGPTLQNTTVGGTALEIFYLGVFGINPKPTNFTTSNQGSPSYMTMLKNQDYIPSISFGYTAGASYRSTPEYASLTLGGYDQSLIGEPLEFIFAGDNSRDIVPVLQSLSTPSDTDSSPIGTELLSGPIYTYMDATVAEIWLPVAACQALEEEFGLVYDNETQLYLVNDTLHDTLVDRNASLTFEFGASADSKDTVSVELPYAALDQMAKPPYQDIANDTRYFPLRRAENDTQYTIGRVFFQEAYISVNYESQRYNISQRSWTGNNSTPHLVAIPEYSGNDRSYPGASEEKSSNGLSGGAIAGIVVGVVAVVAILVGLLIWLFRRRSKSAKAAAAVENEKLGSDSSSTQNETQNEKPMRGTEETVIPKAELDATDRFGGTHYENDKNGLLSPSGWGTSESGGPSSVSGSSPRTPNGTLVNFRDSAHYSPSSPGAGEGTHSSSGTYSAISPMGGGPAGGGLITSATETDGRPRPVFEMAGDMPVIKEKDGHQLSEKEAIAHRERVYNGVDSAEASPDEQPRERASMVAPENVVPTGCAVNEGGAAGPGTFEAHRAFSFEFDRGQGKSENSTEDSDELYR